MLSSCFGPEVFHNRIEFRLMLARPRHDVALLAATHRRRETFLDHDNPVQTVAGKIRHAEAPGIQELLNPELAVQKLRTGLQRVSEGFVLLRGCVHISPSFTSPCRTGTDKSLVSKGNTPFRHHMP